MMDPGSRGMMKSKQAKTSEDGVDMISNLPDPILHLILSRLPTTEEVIRTSILSTRWRYLWTSVSFVDLDYFRGMKPFKEIEKEKFKEIVYGVLESNSLNLDSFRLCSDLYSMSTISRWIYAAVTRNIKSLHLEFWPTEESEIIELPCCLATCGSLVELRLFLFFGRRLVLPKFTGLSALRVLELNDVELFNDDLVNNFLKSCPLLEELSLIDCAFDKLNVLCISCPNLERLKIVNQEQFGAVGDDFCSGLKIFCPKLVFFEFGDDFADSYFFENLGSLKKVVITFEEYPLDSMAIVLCELLVGSSLVESLSTSCDICCGICSLFVSKYKNADVPVFLPNLKTLELTMDFDEDSIDALIQILACFPHMESLKLNIDASYHSLDVSELEEAETMRILTFHLKRVEFLCFNDDCEGPTLHTARLILEHAIALEEMVFRLDCDEANFHKMSTKTIKDVSTFQKASPTVKLVTLLKKK